MKTKMYQRFFSLSFIALMAVAVACSDDDEPAMEEETPTLYTRLGGVEAISSVVDKFLVNVSMDDVIKDRFEPAIANPSRLQLLRNNLIDQICAGSGGPCIYKGKTMLEAHTGMNITQNEFNALVGDLVASLDFHNVKETEKTELLGVLGPMASDIVGK
jgi:hemoglobin